MELFIRVAYLLLAGFLRFTIDFLVIKGGSSLYLSGNCTFDEKTFCSWYNERYTDLFDWSLGEGSSPSNNTGPISDHSGNGSFIYIETSSPRKYNEKARLISPWMRGARRMTFFYSMYGSTIETLSVYVTINGSESRIWSRYGNHLSRNWVKGCVTINYGGNYQVIIEGIAGISYASSIAVDDLGFSKNLTCTSVGKPTSPTIFKVNCTFDEGFCGWRNMLVSSDQISWKRLGPESPSHETGPSGDHTGEGKFIYIEASQLSKVHQSTQLLSPLIQGPKCFRFFYHMSGRDVGRLDVLLQVRGQQGDYLMWRKSGDQGNQWIKASVDIGYTDKCQIVLQGTVGKNFTSRIAADGVTLTDGLCDDESELSSNLQGNCNFDRNFCFWKSDLNFIFKWRHRRYSTPSLQTGPSSDHTSGTGLYIYIETSLPRQPGDTARLTSPWMRGPQCMTFYYHMFGSAMGCVVMYMRSQTTNRLKPVWLRSKDQGNRWIQGQISINKTSSYQIIIDGIRGRSVSGDAALDDFTFQRGTCQQTDNTTYYVSSYKGKDYRISTRPSEHSLYSEEFRFTLEHPRGNPTEASYFIYSEASRGHSFLMTKLDGTNYNNYPLDVVVLQSEKMSWNYRKIYLINRDNMGPMINLEDHSNVDCCKGKVNSFFYAFNVTEPDNRLLSGCQPGWYTNGKSCFMFYFESAEEWRFARNFCHKQHSELAVANNASLLKTLANQRKHLEFEDRDMALGLDSKLRWAWLDGEKVSNAYNMWNPGEPSGDGKCGSFLLNSISWDSNWRGYGWGWNDESCTSLKGYICEEPLDVPLPVALYFLSGTNEIVDLSPNGITKAVSSNITLAPGPFGNLNGSFLFNSSDSSNVELKNNGELDTRFSISAFAWVHLDNSGSGPIFENGCSMWVFHSTLGVEIRYIERESSNIYLLHKEGVLKGSAWNFIGTTYDYHTGLAAVWVNEIMVMQRSIGTNVQLATKGNVTIGASNDHEMQFRGRISCLQFYNQALSMDQIMKVKTRCNQTMEVPATSMEYKSIGCYKDTSDRAITTLEGADPNLTENFNSRTNVIEKCALAARKRGFHMFAVQYGGQCMASVTAEKTFNKYGKSDNCLNDGKGGRWANNVYIIRDYTDLGCYKDRRNRAIPTLEGTDPVLDGYYRDRQNAIEKCAIAARKRGFHMFAVQHGGQCMASATAKKTFNKYGKSDDCLNDGKGGRWANNVYAFQASNLWCSPNFFPFHGGCFSVNPSKSHNWQQALKKCNLEGGTLAKISREGLRYAFSNKLEEMRAYQSYLKNLYIGLLTRDDWTWIDGSQLAESLWMLGYPTRNNQSRSCAYLSAGSSTIKNGDCSLQMYPLCQKQSDDSLSNRSFTKCSSVLLPYKPYLAIDRSYTTCFRSQKESNPWWQVSLDKQLYVVSVLITDKVDCCSRDNGIINIIVSTSQTGLDPTCSESMAYGGIIREFKFQCSPPALGNYVTIRLMGDNVTLVLCHVVVKTIESSSGLQGVLREVWYNKNNYDPDKAESRIVLRDFDAPIDMADGHLQRLTSYLQVPQSGNYTFYVACDDSCELWKHDVKENGIDKYNAKADGSATKQPIISVKSWTKYLQWDKYAEQTSQPIFLTKCRIYLMEVLGRDKRGPDHISVGMRKPNGDYERPIPGTRLFWTQLGTRKLEVTLKNHETSISAFVGSNLHISGFYRFCCEGVYCPDCPVKLYISTLGQNVTVNSSVSLSCVNTSFTASFNTDKQPGNFTVKVTYLFVEQSGQLLEERVLGNVHLKALVLKECLFKSENCGWTSVGHKNKWKFLPGYFAYIGDTLKAGLESPPLPWQPFHQIVSLCLRFKYLMPTKSKSTLKVLLREPKQEKPVLVWQLIGYNGAGWSAAQVAWSGAVAVQVVFEGEGFLHDQVNVAIDDVIVTTEYCALVPYFAKPGYRCGDKQFQCNNGECVKNNFLCDGDFACKDESDEDNCECPSNKFACQDGGCLPATAVCDGTKGCSNGDDENNCRSQCPFKHQCLDGSCISWSNTCRQTSYCRDGTNTPSVCGSGSCLLNDLACTSKGSNQLARCKSFRGHCNFQNNLCDLKYDWNATFQWATASGQTPTEDTGPSFDHTTFSNDGSYIYIEASPQNPGDVARLLSDWMEPYEAVCIQFWYHMRGSDIGNLSIYLKTNQSETLVWRLTGNQGNRWKLGQTPLNSRNAFRFIIEGTVGDGSKGDIALDDLSVLDGNCEKITTQKSPDCDFKENMCDWEAQEGWTLSRSVQGLKKYGGIYIFLRAGAPDVPYSLLSAPIVNTIEWKCFRFQYFIRGNNWYKASLMVLLKTLKSNLTTLLFFADEVTSEAQYTQIPLPSDDTNVQIEIVGANEQHGGQFLAIDYVSFSKEPCKQIPWRQKDFQPLGMENGDISDRQISSSSQIDGNHATIQGRLQFKATPGKAGSWSAGRDDSSQWLQVDLRSQNTKVTGVATQGRNGRYAQWVTKYKLQYSNDGVNFLYYKEQGQITSKDFAGNTDQDTVVFHELNPPIRALCIRLRPQAWYGAVSMRVELYGHQEECHKALGMENSEISNGQIRASSQFDGNAAANQGRLYLQTTESQDGGWSAAKNNQNQWLQVDLGSRYFKVTGVATQGKRDIHQWVTSYKLQYGNDGVKFQYYKEQGKIVDKDFTGNKDRDTVVYHELNPAIRARYIRLRPETWENFISMRMELYGCPDECQENLGIRNGAIPDAQLSASSQWDPHHAAFQGRLDYEGTTWKAGSWLSRYNNKNQWLQIDLYSQQIKVTRVATQGRNAYSQWVKQYKLQYSNNGVDFLFCKEPGKSTDKRFTGNSDHDTVVYNELNPAIKARYIRIRPEAWHGHISMRIELYGCLEDASGVSRNPSECRQALGMENGEISDEQIIASTQFDTNYAAYQARLHFQEIQKKSGSWSAEKNDAHQWLQVDLGSQYTTVTRVATQGRHDDSHWVTKYKLQYSNDELKLQYYREEGQIADKDFVGNSDRSTIVFHELNPPINARFIRFRPQDWFGHIAMRIELYGCQECQKPLGVENGTIADGQLSSSSKLDDAHSAMQVRLNSKATEDKGGSWSAGENDSSQWLQVDLDNHNTNVTRVATQGSDNASQWVTKYKLQYSEDGVNFQYYRGPGETTDKVFEGNVDQETVVYNELNPPITARYIRFRPVAWYGHVSMRVELYGCQDDRPCHMSVDWCGWKSLRGWKRLNFKGIDQNYQDDNEEHDVNNDGEDNDHRDADADDEGIIDHGNYEIHLPDSEVGYVSFSNIAPDNGGFTICFWLKTANSGFFIEYKTAASDERKERLTLVIYCGNNSTFVLQFDNKRSEHSMDVTDYKWHHVCVVWDGKTGLLAVFKDGNRNFKLNGFRTPTLKVMNEGTMKIGFRATKKTSSALLGKLSGFNIWSYAVTAEEILRMSYGCGTEAGDAKAWETVRNGLIKEVEVKFSRTCNDRKGDRFVVDTIATGSNETAVLMSPTFNRSRDGKSRCLKFRYMLQGPGEKALAIYRKTNSYRKIPIWISKRNTNRKWIYGQVPLSSISKFQILITGEVEKKEDLITLAGLYIKEGKHCKHEPQWAEQACSENLTDISGYFFSPSYPGNILEDTFCTWNLTVPHNYIIRLEFQEFRLTDHPKCDDCFLEIFDGGDKTGPSIGRFCGYMYPPVVVSSSNRLTIVLRCHTNLYIARFKAFYHSTGALGSANLSCLPQQGCPSSCKCDEFGEGEDKRILVTGEDLLNVPSNLPSKTGAVFFRQNRISQLHEKDFTGLTKLQYIDISFNTLLHLDEDCFQNVPSVNTMRLNSNFLRTLPVGAFGGLRNLRVLDLGRNLLRKVISEMLDGLSHLEVLSLRSNQIVELEYGAFENKSNMTHLYLQDNKLATLPNGLFRDLSELKLLNLSSNELTAITKESFQGLKSLEYLYLDNNKLKRVPSDAFNDLTNLKYLKLDRFIHCCFAKKSIEGVECDSPVDEFSSCDDLMKNKTVQVCIWILGILAFLGNLLVIIWRAIDKEESRVQSCLLTNLAVADLLMGVYLLTIAIMDVRWRGEYFKHDMEWRSGLGCQIVGVLSMLSSEVSVLILTVITMDRFICIIFPFKFKRLTYRSAVFTCTGVWVFGIVISVIPITGLNYFYDESGDFGFYSRSAVCLPLQLSEGTPAGWEYSFSFFVGLNFISFTFILVAYISMLWRVKRVARAVRSTNLNKESAMAKRLVFIVMTDFCCWMPIIIINILSLTGNFDDPNKIAYVWIAVFVLPLNSSLNPILYTFSTESAKRSLTRKGRNVTGVVMKTRNRRIADQSVGHPNNSGGKTLVSKVLADSSPQPPARAVKTQEPEGQLVHANLKLIEEVDIFKEDFKEKPSTGYVTARCEEGGVVNMVLLKWFGKEMKEDWTREVDVVQSLSCDKDPHANLLHYRWHSKACDQSIEHGNQTVRDVQGNSFLICYDFASSSTLEDFLSEKGIVIDFDAVCAVACDVISAIERLQELGIVHNNITTSNILISQCPRVPPIKAVLGGFSLASKVNKAGAGTNWAVNEQSSYGNHIEQFGQLLATLLGHCHGSSEYIKLHEIVNLCFEETAEKMPKASYIRELLEDACCTEGVRDTYI